QHLLEVAHARMFRQIASDRAKIIIAVKELRHGNQCPAFLILRLGTDSVKETFSLCGVNHRYPSNETSQALDVPGLGKTEGRKPESPARNCWVTGTSSGYEPQKRNHWPSAT